MIGFKLGINMAHCPRYWANFVKNMQQIHNLHLQNVPDTILNKNLAKYNAKLVHLDNIATWAVVFDEDKYYTWFKLEWGWE